MEADRHEDIYRDGYKAGYLAALETFAWWKDGEQLVGCGVRSLKQAKAEFLAKMAKKER